MIRHLIEVTIFKYLIIAIYLIMLSFCFSTQRLPVTVDIANAISAILEGFEDSVWNQQVGNGE